MSVRKRKNNKHIKNIIIASIIAAFSLFLIIGGLIAFYNKGENNYFDENTINSEAYDYNNSVYYKISAEIDISLSKKNGEYDFYLSTDNIYAVRVKIYDGDNNFIAESDFIKPSENIEKINFEALDINRNTNTDGYALITAYNIDTREPMGSKKQNIKLNFKN